jgi:hypothetical protein
LPNLSAHLYQSQEHFKLERGLEGSAGRLCRAPQKPLGLGRLFGNILWLHEAIVRERGNARKRRRGPGNRSESRLHRHARERNPEGGGKRLSPPAPQNICLPCVCQPPCRKRKEPRRVFENTFLAITRGRWPPEEVRTSSPARSE